MRSSIVSCQEVRRQDAQQVVSARAKARLGKCSSLGHA